MGRVGAACFTNLRMIMVFVYAYAVTWLLGRSDGPANVVLDSLSLSFIIAADDVVAKLMSLSQRYTHAHKHAAASAEMLSLSRTFFPLFLFFLFFFSS